MEDEIDFTAQETLTFGENIFEILNAGGVGCDDRGIELLRKRIEFAHTKCYRRIGKGDCRPFFHGFNCNFPRDGMFIECAEDDSALAFQKIVSHVCYVVGIDYTYDFSLRKDSVNVQ